MAYLCKKINLNVVAIWQKCMYQSLHFLLQVTEFKDKWFKECSPIFDEKCKTK